MQLERIDGIIQFFDGTEAIWNQYTQPIPNGLLVYCRDTRIIKKGDGIHTFSELPVFLDLNKIDSIHILVNELIPSVEQLEDFSVSSTVSITELQLRILNILVFINALKDYLGITTDPNDQYAVTGIQLVDQVNQNKENIEQLTSNTNNLQTFVDSIKQTMNIITDNEDPYKIKDIIYPTKIVKIDSTITDTYITSAKRYEEIILVDASYQDVTVQLVSSDHKKVSVKKIDSSGNKVIIAPINSTIDGEADKFIEVQNTCYTIACLNNKWYII